MFNDRYKNFKNKLEENKLYKASFLSLIAQIVSGVSVIFFMLMSLMLFQLQSKLTVDSVILSNINKSSQVAVIDAFNQDMAEIDNKVTRVMIEYFINIVFAMHLDKSMIERKFAYNTEVFYLTSVPVWEKVSKFARPIINKVTGSRNSSSSVEILSITNLTSNLWQCHFNVIIYSSETDNIETQKYTMNIRVGYFPARVAMANTFSNPLGFAVTEFNITKARDK